MSPKAKSTANFTPRRNTEGNRVSKRTVPRAQVSNAIPKVPTETGTVFVWGTGDVGQLGLGDQYDERKKPYPMRTLENAVDIVAGSLHNLVFTKDNGVFSWGVNDNGALGRPVNKADTEELGKNDHIPEPIPALADFSIVRGKACDCASFVLTDKGKVYGWGTFRGNDGVIGFSQHVHTQSEPVLVPELKTETVVDIACGADHVLALTSKGDVWSWGAGAQMQLGRRLVQRRATNSLKAERVGVKRVRLIGCGAYHSFAVDDQNRLWAWGLNNFYQCGIDKGSDGESVVFQPTIVTGMEGKGQIIKIIGGEHHTLILMENGDVYSFGRGDSGELGVPAEQVMRQAEMDDPENISAVKKAVRTPMLVPKTWDGTIVDISSGSHHSMAITKEGNAWAWGFGSMMQLSNGTGMDEFTPIMVTGQKLEDHHVLKIDGGAQHSICLARRN